MTTNLITGAARNVGSAITKFLLDKGEQVIPEVNLSASNFIKISVREYSFFIFKKTEVNKFTQRLLLPVYASLIGGHKLLSFIQRF